MRKLKLLLIIPTATILAAGMTGCSAIQSLVGGTHSTDIAVGQCIKDLGASTDQVGQVTVVDCSEPHLYEVYAEVELSGDQLPDAATIESEADSVCFGTGFSNYVGVAFEETEYKATYLSPSEDTWKAGDRKVSCLITSADDSEMTGSVKGSAK